MSDDAFAQFAKDRRRQLVNLARSLMYGMETGAADPEDAASSAIMKVAAYRHTHSEHEWTKLAMRCLRNTVTDMRTRIVKGKRVPKYENRLHDHIPESERRDLSAHEPGYVNAEWHTVMDSLPCPIDREIMTLLVEGFSPEDIAEKIGKCNRYVSNRIFRQRKILRRQFPEYGGAN